jgi:hypothetical protein
MKGPAYLALAPATDDMEMLGSMLSAAPFHELPYLIADHDNHAEGQKS